MAAVEEYLIRRGDGLVILFTPPFDKSKLDPGYIKGYVPGVRENGGQYTHAALWTLIAFAMLGDGERAGELFSLLNPVNHSSTRAGLHKYKVEPYVAVGDVYAVPPHTGRGGWTWYTGSAGWMYRAGLESILGFKLRGKSCGSIRACRVGGATLRSLTGAAARPIASKLRIRWRSVAASPRSNWMASSGPTTSFR